MPKPLDVIVATNMWGNNEIKEILVPEYKLLRNDLCAIVLDSGTLLTICDAIDAILTFPSPSLSSDTRTV